FKTTDWGQTWTSVVGNLPAKGNINALREDYDNPNLLFCGTELGLFVTLDGGREWRKFMTGMPSVPVDDILIHPRDRDLIIATHGRSIWIADDISPLEQMKESDTTKDAVLFDPRPAIQWKNDPQAQRHATNREFKGQNPQGGTAIHVWAKSDLGKGKLEFLENNQVVSTMDVDVKAGMNSFQWPMTKPVPPGQAAGGRGGRGGGGGAGAAGGEAQPAGGAAEAQGGPGAQGGFGGGGGGGRGRGGFTGVPFVRGGGGFGGAGGFGGGGGALVEPGTYMVKLTVGSQTLTSSVDVVEDIWMRPQ
ncbi:MAG TPA: hypothetical protein VGS58_19775, partial [Candidatus Sulfopaludibacter sp.]|nr:hypothetical protein [Candidatus Sulfopaludibacter sp.]